MTAETARYLILIDIDGGDESGDDLAITVDLPSGTLGAAYTGAYIATGGVLPYTYATSAGSLPTGLSLDTATGAVTGTPTSLGSDDGYFEFTASVTDSAGSPVTVSKVVSIKIGTGIVITGVMPPAEVGIPYAALVSAAGGTPPYTWTIPSGALPTSTSIDSSTGFISGTPTVAGAFNFTARATDSASVPQDFPSSITVAPAVDLSASNYGGGFVDVAYSAGPTRVGGVAPFTYSFTGTIPAGTNFDPRSGFVTGTPTSDNGGTPYAFDVTVLDVLGGTDTFSASVTISAGGGTGTQLDRVMGFSIGGGGEALVVGNTSIAVVAPCNGTINLSTIFLAPDTAAASIVLDVLTSIYSNYDTGTSIVASAPPTLSSAIKAQDAVLTGWTTSIVQGNFYWIEVTSAASAPNNIVLNLQFTPS